MTLPSTKDEHPNSAADPESGGLARVSRRVASRTTDLIAVGVVLIGSLTFGRQAIIWWRTDPDEVTSPAATESSDPWNASPVEIEFGDAPLSLNRQTVEGDRDAAISRLVAECRSVARKPSSAPLESPAAEALLARLSSLKPIEGEPERWSVYRLEDQFSLVVAVRDDPAKDVEGAASRPRLLCFGMVVPAGGSEWTLYLFRGEKGPTSEGGLPSSEVVPDGFRRSLSLRSGQGESFTGVAGEGDAGNWTRSLESKLLSRGWHLEGTWSVVDRTCSARFRSAGSDDHGVISVVMTSDGDGGWTGLIHQSP